MSKNKPAATLAQELAEALDRFVASRPRNERSEKREAALARRVGRLAKNLLAPERPTGELENEKALALGLRMGRELAGPVLSSAPGGRRLRPAGPPLRIPPADVAQR
jgi:hypothetical protein